MLDLSGDAMGFFRGRSSAPPDFACSRFGTLINGFSGRRWQDPSSSNTGPRRNDPRRHRVRPHLVGVFYLLCVQPIASPQSLSSSGEQNLHGRRIRQTPPPYSFQPASKSSPQRPESMVWYGCLFPDPRQSSFEDAQFAPYGPAPRGILP